MAAADNANPNKRDWKKRESFTSALVQIFVVAAILAGAVYFVYQRGSKRKETAERLKEARAQAIRDNPKDLEKALSELDALLQIDPTAPDGLALAADVNTELWLVHRVPGAEAKARDFLKQAEAQNSKSEERFGAYALQLIAEGKAAEADSYVEDLRKKGASSARLWFAQGKAQQALGNLALSKQGFAQAMDKAWKDPRFATAYAEQLIDEGTFLQAKDMLSKATASNPEHFFARLDQALVWLYQKDRVKDAADLVTELAGRDAELSPALRGRLLTAKAELASFEARYPEAVKLADEALAQNPEEHLALYAKARALALSKDPAAGEAFKAAVAKRRTAPVIYFEGAALLQAAGKTADAMALLATYESVFKDVKATSSDGKTVAVLDRDDRYWITKGDILRETGKFDEAMAAYDKAISAENVHLVKAHYAKGAVFLAKKDYDKAIETLTPITPPDGSGTLADAYLAMGDTLFAKKDFAPGCQNFAFALAKLKTQQAPRERLNEILESVSKRLIAAGQKPMAKLWMDEAKPLIQ